MPKKFKEKVRKLVSDRVSMPEYPDRERVQHLIMQVESLFVYAILKSVVVSQVRDPMVREMMNFYQVYSFTPPDVDRRGTMFPKYSVPIFSRERAAAMKKSRKVILSNSITGNAHFIEAVQFVMEKTFKILWHYPLFELPTELDDESLNYLLCQAEFA